MHIITDVLLINPTSSADNSKRSMPPLYERDVSGYYHSIHPLYDVIGIHVNIPIIEYLAD